MTSKRPSNPAPATGDIATAAPEQPQSGMGETVATIAWAVLLAVVIRIFIFEAFEIEGPSMEPTLYNHDRVVVAKFLYGIRIPVKNDAVLTWGLPNPGDVVILTGPRDNVDIVKRVIGLPGDHIEVRRDGVYRNGKAIARHSEPCREEAYRLCNDEVYRQRTCSPRCDWVEEQVGSHIYRTSHSSYEDGQEAGFEAPLADVMVPQGQIFVMGDHRDESNDSRFFGPVSATRLKGRALFVYWSGGWPWESSFRWPRIGKGID